MARCVHVTTNETFDERRTNEQKGTGYFTGYSKTKALTENILRETTLDTLCARKLRWMVSLVL